MVSDSIPRAKSPHTQTCLRPGKFATTRSTKSINTGDLAHYGGDIRSKGMGHIDLVELATALKFRTE